ncbi:FHIPEP family type III secretion protein [bacterium]|nr:FHIPEP family type III secretion protein [bacterium]
MPNHPLRRTFAKLFPWLAPAHRDGVAQEMPYDDPIRDPEAVLLGLNAPPIRVEVGSELIGLVDASSGGTLMDGIVMLRVKLAEEMGWVIPGVQFRDNPGLTPLGYRLFVWGQAVAEGIVMPGMMGVDPESLSPEQAKAARVGERPATGQLVAWIPQTLEQAAQQGVSADEMLLEHLEVVLRKNLYRLVTPDSLSFALDRRLRLYGRELADELLSRFVTRGEFMLCLRELLKAGRSVRDLPQIVEALYTSCHERCTRGSTPSDAMFGMALQVPQFTPYDLAQSVCRQLGWPPLDERLLRSH